MQIECWEATSESHYRGWSDGPTHYAMTAEIAQKLPEKNWHKSHGCGRFCRCCQAKWKNVEEDGKPKPDVWVKQFSDDDVSYRFWVYPKTLVIHDDY